MLREQNDYTGRKLLKAAFGPWFFSHLIHLYSNGSPTDLGWVAGCVLLAWAAWQPRIVEPAAVIEGWPLLVAPVALRPDRARRAALRPRRTASTRSRSCSRACRSSA